MKPLLSSTDANLIFFVSSLTLTSSEPSLGKPLMYPLKATNGCALCMRCNFSVYFGAFAIAPRTLPTGVDTTWYNSFS